MARSFRSGSLKTLITHDESSTTVFGEVRTEANTLRALGVSRALDGGVNLRIAGEPVRSVALLADELPLLLINAESFELLTGQPLQRRRFLDWGVFHVEHSFREQGQRFQRALSQRNHLLRRGRLAPEELAPWNRDVALYGEAVSEGRERFINRLQPAFAGLLEVLAPELGDVDLRYRRGWEAGTAYLEVLERSLGSDKEQGFTQSGPQRADLKVSVGGYSAAETLSRGQQKLVVCALKLAQGRVLAEGAPERAVYLIDDLPSELDAERCERVCRCLSGLGAQTLLTCVDRDAVPAHWLGEQDEVAMFHVEHGQVAAI